VHHHKSLNKQAPNPHFNHAITKPASPSISQFYNHQPVATPQTTVPIYPGRALPAISQSQPNQPHTRALQISTTFTNLAITTIDLSLPPS
jgi:hypothetical protein